MSSVTIDIKDFSSPQFNAKNWINSVLKPTDIHDQDDGGIKDTTILVTKLQMTSESTSRQFDQLSTAVLKSMPRILYDLKHISDSAQSTHQGIEQVKRNLGLIEGDTEAALEQLRKPHIAKIRMEQCHAILLEKQTQIEQEQKEKEALDSLMQQQQEQEEKKRKEEKERREEEERKELEELRKEQELKELEKVEKLVLEEKKIDEGLEYGHVQLPPLRTTPRRIPTPTYQQHQNNNSNVPEDSYLQQIQDTITPTNMFKRIGVPLDKFWQS